MMKSRSPRLLSLREVITATGAPEEALREGIASGKLRGWYELDGDGEPWFRSDIVNLVRWSSSLADAMVEGAVGLREGERLFRLTARRMLLGLPPEPILGPRTIDASK